MWLVPPPAPLATPSPPDKDSTTGAAPSGAAAAVATAASICPPAASTDSGSCDSSTPPPPGTPAPPPGRHAASAASSAAASCRSTRKLRPWTIGCTDTTTVGAAATNAARTRPDAVSAKAASVSARVGGKSAQYQRKRHTSGYAAANAYCWGNRCQGGPAISTQKSTVVTTARAP